MRRRKILVKAKGLEMGQGRREIFLPNTRIFPNSAYHSILPKSFKRPCSVSGLCKILLASVDELFHPDGPIELKPQSVKHSYGRQNAPCRSHRGPAGNADGFPVEAGNSHQDFCISVLCWVCSDLCGETTEWVLVPVVQSNANGWPSAA